ncbi:hypothetical protein GCM10009098_32540 [Rheinheimera aquimaris]|uniref:Uncharacterized protein n=1 Tax=Rheinheimera aquimaris TaxID=412437 RepID=A0ABN1E9K9_9GAMM
MHLVKPDLAELTKSGFAWNVTPVVFAVIATACEKVSDIKSKKAIVINGLTVMKMRQCCAFFSWLSLSAWLEV